MEINRLVLPQRDGLGDTSETTAAKGRARFRYLEETSSVRDPREAGMERYASGLGRDTLSLVRSCEVGYETTDPSALSKGDASDDEDDNDSADSDDEKPPPAAAPVSHVDAEGHGRGAEDLTAEEKQTNLMMDMDWDTTQWSLREIEAACSALVQEIKDCPLDGPGQKRRDYSQQMLLRLCNRHVEALYYFERVLESMVNHSLPGLSYGLDQHALNLAPLLAAMAPIHDYAQRLLDIKTIRRVIDILLVEPNLAANIIQCAVHMRFFCDPTHHHYASKLPDDAPEAEVLLHEKENRERCRRKYFAKCMEHEALVNKWKRAKAERLADLDGWRRASIARMDKEPGGLKRKKKSALKGGMDYHHVTKTALVDRAVRSYLQLLDAMASSKLVGVAERTRHEVCGKKGEGITGLVCIARLHRRASRDRPRRSRAALLD